VEPQHARLLSRLQALALHAGVLRGRGTGGVLAAAMLDEPAAARINVLRDALAGALTEPGLAAAHLILRDPAVPDASFQIGGKAPDFPRAGAVLAGRL